MRFKDIASPSSDGMKMPFFVGCRILWTDERQIYHFGVIYQIKGDTLYAVDDKGQPQTVNFLRAKKYDGWNTEKKTGQNRALTPLQKRLLQDAEDAPKPPAYFKRKAMRSWGIPLMRAVYAWANKRYFGSKLLVRGRIFPPFGSTKRYGVMGTYFLRTKKIVANPGQLTNIEQVSITVIHEMIHMYDHLIRKSPIGRGYDAHGEWFQEYADRIERDMKVKYIKNVTDNLDGNILDYTATIEDGDPEDAEIPESIKKISNKKASAPYFLVVLIDRLINDGTTANFYGIRTKSEDQAFDIAQKVENAGGRFYIGIYGLNTAYFEELIPAAGNVKISNYTKVWRKLTMPQLKIIQEYGKVDDIYGDIITWYIKRLKNAAKNAPSEES